uniref:Peptidylglycine alpha-amidating monooxygenase n=1 Tax=Oncorhynchus kisutch TaxID=8019 RepID=A0A8C7LGA5_ONCKI
MSLGNLQCSLSSVFYESASSEPNDCTTRTGQPMVLSKSGNFSLDVRMPGVSPTVSDTYLCVAVPVPTTRDAYIVDFEPHASMDTAHHMLLYGCRTPVSTTNYWDCGSVKGTCEDEASIMYAWARNAPPTRLPPDVGFKVGGKSRITYFVLQIHYGDVHAFSDQCLTYPLCLFSFHRQPFIAGMYLMMSVTTVIPPGNKVTNADVACTYNSYPIYPFAFRTHTHKLGQVVSGYRIRDGKWTLIGRQTPQLPQVGVWPCHSYLCSLQKCCTCSCPFTDFKGNDWYKGTSDDEMCNFYMMYYMESRHAAPFQECMEDGSKELFQNIPPEANVPITVPPEMMMHNMMHSAGAPSTPGNDMALLQPKREEEEVLDQEYHLEEVTDWPESPLQLGQVSGLALDSDDNLVIFHRGDHQWGVNSFDNSGKYQQQSLGPIQQSTILVVDPVKGSVLKASGRNMFYLPHGITTDKDNNYWVTDVALHQVFKLSSDGRDKPLVVLGEAFEPGSDKEHFCKPTDVAVDPVTGNVYVSDGYCNARILKFSPEGKYLSHWGAGSSDRRRRVQFRIPHSLVFLPDRRELCVADRENGRIQCFVAESGEFVKEIKKQEFGGEVFAISYAPVHGGLIYAVNGESAYGRSAPLKGFVINYSTKEILDDFSPENFGMPHDIVVTKDGRVFVGDAATDSVLKFSSDSKSTLTKVFQIIQDTIIQTRLKPQHRVEVAVAKVQIPVATQQKTAEPVQEQPQKPQQQEDDKEKTLAKQSAQGVSPAVITTLLLIPLVVVISIGVLIRYRKNRMYGGRRGFETSSGGILGKLRGKAAGGLNLGNFFATHKGYTRQGFDRLSTEGSDQEKDDDNDTDSENEEYSAPPPPVGPSSSS